MPDRVSNPEVPGLEPFETLFQHLFKWYCRGLILRREPGMNFSREDKWPKRLCQHFLRQILLVSRKEKPRNVQRLFSSLNTPVPELELKTIFLC